MFPKMNVYRIRNLYKLNWFRSAHSVKKQEADVETLPVEDAKLSLTSTGINVASLENYSPLTQLTITVKAGSRNECHSNLGITHVLKTCATLSTKNQSSFAITRSLELLGAKLSISSTREHIFYSLICERDNALHGLEILSDVVLQPAFYPWEVASVAPFLHIDLAEHKKNVPARLMDLLHKASFRGGLQNSLICPKFMISKHTSDMLHNFITDNFAASKISVVGLGISHDELQSSVNKMFHVEHISSAVETPVTKFAAGEERLEIDSQFVHAAIVSEGASLSNSKEVLALSVLQCILGIGSHVTTLGVSKVSKLGEAVAKVANKPFYVSSLNVSYSDSGIFGAYVVGHQDEMQQIIKAVVSQMRGATKNISDKMIATAKNKLKAKLRLEHHEALNKHLPKIFDVSQYGNNLKSIVEVEKEIDGLKTSDITSIAARVIKAKPALAAIGRLHSTPHVDELI